MKKFSALILFMSFLLSSCSNIASEKQINQIPSKLQTHTASVASSELSSLQVFESVWHDVWHKSENFSQIVGSKLAKQNSWNTSSFTNLSSWNNSSPLKKYRLLITAIVVRRPDDTIDTSENTIIETLKSRILYINNSPTDRVYSATIIDQAHNTTYENSNIGIVLQTDGQNVVAAAGHDLFTYDKRVEWGFARWGDSTYTRESEYATALLETKSMTIETPDEILAKTSPTQHNEVVLFGSSKIKNKIKASHIFFFKKSTIKEQTSLESKATSLAKELNIPLVIIHRD